MSQSLTQVSIADAEIQQNNEVGDRSCSSDTRLLLFGDGLFYE